MMGLVVAHPSGPKMTFGRSPTRQWAILLYDIIYKSTFKNKPRLYQLQSVAGFPENHTFS